MTAHFSPTLIAAELPSEEISPNPFALPLTYDLPFAQNVHDMWSVTISHDEVMLEKAGQPGQSFPIEAFEGVVISVNDAGDAGFVYAVNLVHEVLDLTIPLYSAYSEQDILSRWRNWGQVLGLPVLVEEPDGSYSHPFHLLGKLAESTPRPQRPELFAHMRASGIWPVVHGAA